MDNKITSKKNLLLKISVFVLIGLTLIIIWVLKSQSDLPADEQTAHADFVLEAAAIDLDALKEHNLPIIIDFGADSCDPCKKMAPVLVKLNSEMQGKAIIKFVDVWKNGDVARDFPVQIIPTQVFINADGTPYIPSNDIGIKFHMYSYNDTGEHAFTVHQGALTESQMKAILADMGVSE